MFIETFSTSLIAHSIARSHEIERVFVDAAKLTHDFYVTHARLPTQEEFRALVSISEEDPLMYSPPPFDASMVAKAGKPPPSGFVLDYWRGEWMEQYISWTKQSTLKFDASEYFLFHSQLIQAAFMFGLSLLCVAMSVWTWPNKTAATAFGQNFDSTV
jgi:hypothetical protein